MTTTLFLLYNIYNEKGGAMPKKIKPIIIDARVLWNAQKPHYNAYQTGHGAHGKDKYSRKQKHKVDWRNYDYD